MTTNNEIALQLYTAREATQKDMLGTLERLAQIGYRAVELAGYGNATVPEIQAQLQALDMKAVSMHAGIALFEENLSQLMADLYTLGCQYVVVPYLPAENRNKDYVLQLVPKLNEWGKLCQAEGLQLCYHNHNFEFEPLEDGSTIWDIITSQTDPALVKLELDLYWASVAGKDPRAVVESLPGRLPLLHIKDMSEAANRIDVPVGEGILPWSAILEESRRSQSQWYIVEQDHPQEVFGDVERSLHNLQKLLAATPANR